MPPRRRANLDPLSKLVRMVDRLGQRHQFVTLQDVERVAARPSSPLSPDVLAVLIEEAVADSVLLKDLRTFFDRKSGAFTERWVYRVNPRHPLVADLLDED